mmetsp:Transcript_43909/g.58229  ORF Transcript_43909/g.58229 Transcript_43909/m.58229 type:complete len:134 (+) Transcript_43909:672-1073(+)|eukprot:CAMPEP_0185599664 /NCGR_PEP_ID=MMETSP0434-20130131/82857_1 /TAXON_ID=626734 ORGANISM="Favella taraikaensis, Strain Fe Narragansett Bay" /NCGR_SAMPLE_ID=MMETSP0434 /ASSEMBLY_ACC=CAM_ASM_000379 /LENGTH=133 /DNA_ID=CAMNT_0028229143 /DNA_START=1269 /DNA_END=1670 /DNA_ORIENTATION=+
MAIILVVLNKNNYVKLRALECSKQTPLFSTDLNNFADNIHMVEFEDFVHDQRLLAHKTLAVVPTQVVNYFLGQGIDPKAVQQNEVLQMTQRLADHDFIDDAGQQDEYFKNQQEHFVQILVNMGLNEDVIRQFL